MVKNYAIACCSAATLVVAGATLYRQDMPALTLNAPPFLFPLMLSLLAMVAIVGVRYFAVSGLFAWLTQRRSPELYAGLDKQMAMERRWSMISAVLYALPAGFAAFAWQNWGWTQIYDDVGAYPLWWLPASLLIYLFLHDSWFYWSHRIMHHPKLFRFMHAVHHASRPPTAWAAMSFHWSEALSGAFIIPFLVFVIPVHVAVLATVLTIMTVMGVTNHMGWEIFPRALVQGTAGRWLITATHHQKHHQIYRGNYGLYFRFWDRLCGTDVGMGKF